MIHASRNTVLAFAVAATFAATFGTASAGAAVITTTSPENWQATFTPTTQINLNPQAAFSAPVRSYFYGSPWDGSGVAAFAARPVAQGGLSITGPALEADDWISVDYNGLGVGMANNGYLTFSSTLDVSGNAGDSVAYRFGFAGDNRVMGVSIVADDVAFPLYTYEAPAVAPNQGNAFYRGFASSIIVDPGTISIPFAFTSLRLEVSLYNEQNFDSFGPSSPAGLIFAGDFSNPSGPASAGIPEPASFAPLLAAPVLLLARRRRRTS